MTASRSSSHQRIDLITDGWAPPRRGATTGDRPHVRMSRQQPGTPREAVAATADRPHPDPVRFARPAPAPAPAAALDFSGNPTNRAFVFRVDADFFGPVVGSPSTDHGASTPPPAKRTRAPRCPSPSTMPTRVLFFFVIPRCCAVLCCSKRFLFSVVYQ